MQMSTRLINLLIILHTCISCTQTSETKSPLPKAPFINLTRLTGQWHVPARIPTLLDKKATEMTVLITPESDQSLKLKWEFKGSPDDTESTTWNFTSRLAGQNETASWIISPFWPIRFHYQVIEYSADYTWFIIGSRDRKNVWVLSRDQSLAPGLLDSLLERLRTKEFDVVRVVRENSKRPH